MATEQERHAWLSRQCDFLRACLRDCPEAPRLPEYLARTREIENLPMGVAEERLARLEIELKAADDGLGRKIIDPERYRKFDKSEP